MNILNLLTRFQRPILTGISMVLVTSVLFVACNLSSTGDESSGSTGLVNLMLTDAPALFDEVNIEVEQVLIHREEDEDLDEEEDPDDNGERTEEELEDEGWIVVSNEPFTIDLLTLTNGNTLDLGSAELEAGEYSQVRLVLGDSNFVVQNGQQIDLTTPSAQQSGFKVILDEDFEIEAGETLDILIDFDASRSIVVTGSGKLILKPVIKAVTMDSTASIEGRIIPVEANPFVYAISNGDTLGGTLADEGDGRFELIGLKPGAYDVAVNPTDDTYADTTIIGIELEANEDFEFEDPIVLQSNN